MTPRSASVVLAAVLVALGLAAPASADIYQHRDQPQDVNDTSAVAPCAGCFPIGPAPTNRTEDIVRMSVRFDDSGLHLRLGTRSTPRRAPVPGVSWWILTPSSESYVHVSVDARRNGMVHVDVDGDDPACSDTTATFSLKPRRWTTDISPACLEGASWVQVGATTARRSFNDDALVDGLTCCSAPALSPKVRRG